MDKITFYEVIFYILLAICGGLARETGKLESKEFKLNLFIAGAFTSAFAGIVFTLIGFGIADQVDWWSDWFTAILCALGGWGGAPVLDWLVLLIKSWTEKKIKET